MSHESTGLLDVSSEAAADAQVGDSSIASDSGTLAVPADVLSTTSRPRGAAWSNYDLFKSESSVDETIMKGTLTPMEEQAVADALIIIEDDCCDVLFTCLELVVFGLFGVLPFVILALPWSCVIVCGTLSWNGGSEPPKGSKQDCLYHTAIICSLGFNMIGGLAALHLTETLHCIAPWEIALIAWWASLFILAMGSERAKRRGYNGGMSAVAAQAADDEYDKNLLAVFGVVASDTGSSNDWSYGLVATLPAVASYYVACWFMNPHPYVLDCAHPPSACRRNHTLLEHIPTGVPSEDGEHCCVAAPREFDINAFLAQTGANILIVYAVIRCIAKFMIWRDGQIKFADTRLRRHGKSAWRPSASPKQSAFASMRFDGVVPGEAAKLKAALFESNVALEIINMKAGGDIDAAVIDSIEHCDTFIVFGSAKYGEDTGNPASTYYESKFAQDRKKNIVLIRMIPYNEEFEHPQARFLFGQNMYTLEWQIGSPMPTELVSKIVDAMQIIPTCSL